MCGITGWFDFDNDPQGNNTDIITNMTNSLTHRGPDADGYWLEKNLALGHKRLIIIDPSGGLQPMKKRVADNNFIIVYNGEIYNIKELRDRLIAKGWKFETRSDTELILCAFIEWGPESLQYLNGIFSFAIWNQNKQELFLARDRIGVKPLFYSKKTNFFAFGSEIKSLLAHPKISSRLGREGIAEILTLGPARTPGVGVFEDIKELKPGHFIIVNKKDFKTIQYWKLESHEHPDDFDQTVEKIKELLFSAIERQTVSDVPVGCMLSGGLDSSAISAYTSELFNKLNLETLNTFSIDYKENHNFFTENEFQPNADAPWANLMAKKLQTNHHNILLDDDDLIKTILPAMRSRDLPGMADIDASLLLFCKEIKKTCTVVLSGECADEIFGGYPWFYKKEMIDAQTFPWARLSDNRLQFLSPNTLSYEEANKYIKNRYDEALAEVPKFHKDNPKEARMREIFYLSLTRWMPTLLDRKDRMSMAAGVEARVPFCDHLLVEYLWNVPWEFKNYKGREKGILRYALKDLLPEEIIFRKKSPYPKTHNPKYLQNMLSQVKNLERNSELYKLLSYDHIQKFIQSDLNELHLPWFGQLMNVPALLAYWLQLDTWLKEKKISI